MNMDDMLQKLMEQLKPGYAIIVKLGDALEEKEDTTERGQLAEEMNDAEMKTPASGGGYQGGAGL